MSKHDDDLMRLIGQPFTNRAIALDRLEHLDGFAEAFGELAQEIYSRLPDGVSKTRALERLRESLMWCGSSVTLDLMPEFPGLSRQPATPNREEEK